jgi:hypothetical protein
MAQNAPVVITADTQPSFEGFTARLAARARLLAEVAATRAALARRNDPQRWRQSALLWPLFGQG